MVGFADSVGRSGGRGAYGLKVSGVPEAEHLLVPAQATWPSLEIVVERGRAAERKGRVDEDTATVVFRNGGSAVVERSTGRAVFTLPYDPTPDELVHPYLAPAAAALNRWHGRESFHAGGFVVGTGVWGVLAEREGGKSSTLARLALEGIAIVCDDVLVLDGETVFAGPRAIDLREEPARALGVGNALGMTGARERWRMTLDDIDGSFPLRGWVLLGWGDDIVLERLTPGQRLQRLAGQRTVRLAPQDPGVLVRLSALPGYELRRPRHWSSLERAVEVLLASLE